jgi:hypothetical protein
MSNDLANSVGRNPRNSIHRGVHRTPLNAQEQLLASEMKTYWGNFVNSQNPNSPRVPSSIWTAFNATGAVQNLIPGPQLPEPFFTIRQERVCTTWEPIINVETGLVP